MTGAEVAEVPKAVDVGGEIALTPEQRAMLSALLAPPEESAAAAAAGEAEAEYVEHELKVSLDAVSIALVEHHSAAVVSAGDVAPEHQEIAQMAVRRLHVCIAKRCAGLRGEGSLGTLELVDCAAAEGMLGRELIRPASTLRSSDPGVACEPQWRFRLVQSPEISPHCLKKIFYKQQIIALRILYYLSMGRIHPLPLILCIPKPTLYFRNICPK